MMLINWINVMCIHSWRSEMSIHPISPRIFYAYVSYATGLPLISFIAIFVDYGVSGEANFYRRWEEGELNENYE